jgi:hypothetical protein
MTPADLAPMRHIDHAFMYGSDRCVDEDGVVWVAITWHPSYFVPGDDGKQHHVLYHHECKHVYINDADTMCRTEWSAEDRAHQTTLYDYGNRPASVIAYNGRTWARLDTIPQDMEGLGKMLVFSDRTLTEAIKRRPGLRS